MPEISEGIVMIKSVAREPGARTKVAVFSSDEKVDPMGACVGHRGTRVQSIVNELYGEKIDIVRWNERIDKFIGEALSPAKSVSVKCDEDTKTALVIMPDSQLSLAIGKSGQNVRLAARLTGWRIDIRSEGQLARAALTGEDVAGITAEPAPEVPGEPVTTDEVIHLPTSEDEVIHLPESGDGALHVPQSEDEVIHLPGHEDEVIHLPDTAEAEDEEEVEAEE